MDSPEMGERVHVYPLHPNIPASSNAGDWLEPGGRLVAWSPFWQARFNDGSISLHDPRPAPAAPPKE